MENLSLFISCCHLFPFPAPCCRWNWSQINWLQTRAPLLFYTAGSNADAQLLSGSAWYSLRRCALASATLFMIEKDRQLESEHLREGPATRATDNNNELIMRRARATASACVALPHFYLSDYAHKRRLARLFPPSLAFYKNSTSSFLRRCRRRDDARVRHSASRGRM